MGFPTTGILDLIYQLLPGFVAAWIFYGLTAHPKKDSFERSVQALIFTGIVKAIIIPIRYVALSLGKWKSIGVWSSDCEYLLSIGFGILVGFVFTYFANTNHFHTFISSRVPDLTKRTSYPSEWFSAFNRSKRHVYLHLDGDRRIWGWAEEWPDSSEAGHFVLMDAKWILNDNTSIDLLLIERILISAKDVVMVEFEIPEADRKHDPKIQANAEQIMVDLRKNATDNPSSTN